MMRIRYFSDLHLEFRVGSSPRKMEKLLRKITPANEEICVLAGDIGHPHHKNYDVFMEQMSRHFKKTFVIAGNHEYYHHKLSISEINRDLHEYFRKFSNITFLDNSAEFYEGRWFVGTTLWSKITAPAYEINDVYKIRDFDYIKYNRANRECVDFLEDFFSTRVFGGECVVITHHVPSHDFIDPKYKVEKMRPYNQWFYCDMDDFVEKHKNSIRAWFYGHTHTPGHFVRRIKSDKGFNKKIDFVCNPIGYPNENPDTDAAFQKTIVL